MRLHTNLTPERWFKFTLFEQMANVGTDIERAINWKKNNNPEFSKKAFERALELLELTITDTKHKSSTRKELLRTREALIDYFVFDNEYNTNDEIWQRYFYDFNYVAAIQKGK